MAQVPFAQGQPFNSGPVWDQMNFIDNPAPPSGGGLSTGALGGLLNIANMGMSMMQNAGADASLRNYNQTAGLMGDISRAAQARAVAQDIFNQQQAARWASGFKINDPDYYMASRRAAFPDLAGKYGGARFATYT